MTIRRDLEEPIRSGSVIKALGGVQRASAPSCLYETALHSRIAVHRAEKQAIARRALERIEAGSTVFLDGSTTCLELAKALARSGKAATVVTNSALACLELGRSGAATVIGLGGQFDANSLCYVGSQAEDAAGALFVDTAFVGTKGFIPSEGTFESSLPLFCIKRIIATRAARLVLLVDHSKFGQRALSRVLETAQIHEVITDDGAAPSDIEAMEAHSMKVCIAARGPKNYDHAA
jgi:DeoR/GlpR family transcriptional regulator of sugar metabolism